MVFKAYNALTYPLSSADLGGFVLAIVELRCLDVAHSPSAFSRVSLPSFFFPRGKVRTLFQTYWIEALSLRCLSAPDSTDEEFLKKVVEIL